MADPRAARFQQSLRRIYQRSQRPEEWKFDGNLPWADPTFGERMLQEHLDDTHGAASRVSIERDRQINWIWNRLGLEADCRLLDITCGPGLYGVEFAKRGARVTGVDYAPTSIRYARDLAEREGMSAQCDFQQQDLRELVLPAESFDAAILLYGQLAVFPRPVAGMILQAIAKLLTPGGHLLVEMLNPEHIDRTDTNWWFTDSSGIWGEGPFLHLGERFWNEAEQLSTERFHTLHLDTGQLSEMQLNDQAYEPATFGNMLQAAGFRQPDLAPGWSGLELYDASEWIVYLTQRAR